VEAARFRRIYVHCPRESVAITPPTAPSGAIEVWCVSHASCAVGVQAAYRATRCEHSDTAARTTADPFFTILPSIEIALERAMWGNYPA
jgi:hypothetical protein